MYNQRLQRNFRQVMIDHGVKIDPKERFLESISPRHVHNIANGDSNITVKKLELIADEIGADMLEFFKK